MKIEPVKRVSLFVSLMARLRVVKKIDAQQAVCERKAHWQTTAGEHRARQAGKSFKFGFTHGGTVRSTTFTNVKFYE